MSSTFTLRCFGYLLVVVCLSIPLTAQRSFTLRSPDGKTAVTIQTADQLTLSISRGRPLVTAAIALEVEGGKTPGISPIVERSETRSVNELIRPVVPEKRSTIPDVFEELTVSFIGGYAVQVRAYDDGVSYRFVTSFPRHMIVKNERVELHFQAGDSIYFPQEESFSSHNERLYSLLCINTIPDTAFCSLPALVARPDGMKLFLSEADVEDYPGMFLRGGGKGMPVLTGIFPKVPMEEHARTDHDVIVTKHADYIASTSGTRTYPWRVVGIAEKDGDLLLNDIIYRLGKPLALTETNWIKPGKVAWDWWNANNISGVSFTAGINTETYKYYIDFASKYGLEYVIFDEGWSLPGDLSKINPAMDMELLCAYAKERNVGIVLWTLWNALEADLERTLDRFRDWGIRGIKVDFMQRQDQRMVNYYWRVAAEAAKRRLLVDFHGAYKPDGMRRTYPNVLTREGVRGLEWSKWSKDVTPPYDVTIPFIRMVAGPMDFTPGAMVNSEQGNFTANFTRPMSQGTRCHQLAMYVIYESPLQMLADNPSNYMKEPGTMQFLAVVPTVWDETMVLDASVGRSVALARRRGADWYLGAMTDWSPRDVRVKFDFLDEGEYTLRLWLDGVNAHRYASDLRMETMTVRRGGEITLHLAPGGGCAGILQKVRE